MTSTIENNAIQYQDNFQKEDIFSFPRCSTPITDPSLEGGRRVFYLPDENVAKIPSTTSREYNDWKKRLQRKKSSRYFKVRGSVPGVSHFGAPNALPYPDPDASMTSRNCSIISGHFELKLVPIRISGKTIARPEPVHQMQWFPVPNPQFYSNNCNAHPALFYNAPYVYRQGCGNLCYPSGAFFNRCEASYGAHYPGIYYACGGLPKPQFLTQCNYAQPRYNYPGQPVLHQGQIYYQYNNTSAFIAYAAAARLAAGNATSFYPNYVPLGVGGHSMYGIQPQRGFPQFMMTF